MIVEKRKKLLVLNINGLKIKREIKWEISKKQFVQKGDSHFSAEKKYEQGKNSSKVHLYLKLLECAPQFVLYSDCNILSERFSSSFPMFLLEIIYYISRRGLRALLEIVSVRN